MSVLCTGSVAVDHIMVFRGRFRDVILPDKVHMLNVAFHVPELRRSFGGTAANIAFNLRLLGADPLILATVGAEDFGAYADWLDRHGLRRDHLLALEGEATAGAYITTDLDDNQITGFHPGAMDRAHEHPVSAVDAPYRIGVVSPNGKQAMLEHARALKQGEAQTVVDPGQGLPLFSRDELVELLTGADLYVVNDYEWQLTQNTTGLGLDAMLERVGALIITRGDEGATLHRKGGPETIPVVAADRVVDPTGCGDAFRAGLLYGMLRDLDLAEAAKLGSVMGSLMVEHAGTQVEAFGPEQVRARHHRAFGCDAPLGEF